MSSKIFMGFNLKRGFLSAICFFFLLFISTPGTAQKRSSSKKDSIPLKTTLSEVVVRAFEQSKKLSDQPAAVSYISSHALDRYNRATIVSAMNAVPGVRMEQRSPGSYRLNIRGSSLRSPWGVRNVKVYYNGIPFTNPGGKTYLEQLRAEDFGAIEIIKGPAGSLYGAGTGGVVLIKSALYADTAVQSNGLQVSAGGGSFGTKKMGVYLRWGKEGSRNALRYSDIQSDGYRDHTALQHETAAYETEISLNDKEKLEAFFHYSDLFYQTP